MQAKTVTVTFRTEPEVKERAENIFNSIGLTLSSAIEMCLHQTVNTNRYPCSLDTGVTSNIEDTSNTYPPGFFSLFGCNPQDELVVPEELPFLLDSPRETL